MDEQRLALCDRVGEILEVPSKKALAVGVSSTILAFTLASFNPEFRDLSIQTKLISAPFVVTAGFTVSYSAHYAMGCLTYFANKIYDAYQNHGLRS